MNKTEQRIVAIAGIFIGLLACVAAWLALPQIQKWFEFSPAPNLTRAVTPTTFASNTRSAVSTPEVTFGKVYFYALGEGGSSWPQIPLEMFPIGFGEVMALIEYTATAPIEVEVSLFRNNVLLEDYRTTMSLDSGHHIRYLSMSRRFNEGEVYTYQIKHKGDVQVLQKIQVGYRPTIFPMSFCKKLNGSGRCIDPSSFGPVSFVSFASSNILKGERVVLEVRRDGRTMSSQDLTDALKDTGYHYDQLRWKSFPLVLEKSGIYELVVTIDGRTEQISKHVV